MSLPSTEELVYFSIQHLPISPRRPYCMLPSPSIKAKAAYFLIIQRCGEEPEPIIVLSSSATC